MVALVQGQHYEATCQGHLEMKNRYFDAFLAGLVHGHGTNIRCSKLLRQQMKHATTKLVLVEWHLEMDRNFDTFLAGLVDGHERDEAWNNSFCTGGDDTNIQCSKLLHTE